MASQTLLRRAPKSVSSILPHAFRPLTTTSLRLSTTAADPSHPANPREPLAPSAPKERLAAADSIVLSIKNRFSNSTETYISYKITRSLYTECGEQAAYVDRAELSPAAEFWYTRCRRDPTFNSWAEVTILHMWMLTVKMRMFEKSQVGIWQQHFIDHFFHDSEDKMAKRYGVTSNPQRAGYMKNLYHQYRGMVAAFDEGLMKGDAVMATALWRNIFNGDEDVDLEALAVVTSYVRRVTSKLGVLDNEIIRAGGVKFTSPESEVSLVNEKSRLLDKIAQEAKMEMENLALKETAGAAS